MAWPVGPGKGDTFGWIGRTAAIVTAITATIVFTAAAQCSVTDTVIRWVCLLLQRKWKLSDAFFKIVRSTRVDPDVLSYRERRKR